MDRYSIPYEKKHSISYTRDPVFAPVKIFAGFHAHEYFDRNGSMEGYLGRGGRDLVERIGDQIPCVPDMFALRHRGKNDFAGTIARRGIFCLPQSKHKEGNDELSTLRHMTTSYTAMEELLRNPTRVLTEHHLAEFQEKLLILTSMPGPHVYRRTNPAIPREIYLGSSENDPGVRNKGHQNSPLFLSGVWSVPNFTIAKAIEGHGHQYLREHCTYTRTGRGWYVTPWEDPGAVMDKFLKEHYGRFFHNRARLDYSTSVRIPSSHPTGDEHAYEQRTENGVGASVEQHGLLGPLPR